MRYYFANKKEQKKQLPGRGANGTRALKGWRTDKRAARPGLFTMTNEEKIKKFEEVQSALWGMAVNGNLLQATVAASIIRELKIESPEGDDPESA